jgi:hypothetical protein
MATPLRTLLTFIAGLFAATQAAGTSSRAEVSHPGSPIQVETLTLSGFAARVRQDSALRARFAANPRAVLREFGIDPAPYNLPDRLTEAQIDRFVTDWSRGAGTPIPRPETEPAQRPPPVVIYGPPAGFPKRP